VDTAARIVAPGLQEAFGQPFIVENRAGAGGLIAGEFVAKSAPDGYTLFFTANSPLLHAPIIYNRPAYHWEKDFVAVSMISYTPIVLQVHPSVPAKSLKELLDLAKREPGKLAMATPSASASEARIADASLMGGSSPSDRSTVVAAVGVPQCASRALFHNVDVHVQDTARTAAAMKQSRNQEGSWNLLPTP